MAYGGSVPRAPEGIGQGQRVAVVGNRPLQRSHVEFTTIPDDGAAGATIDVHTDDLWKRRKLALHQGGAVDAVHPADVE